MKTKLQLTRDSQLKEILAYEEGRAIFDRFLPGMRQMVESQPGIMSFPLSRLIAFSQGRIPAQVPDLMEAAFAKLEIWVEEKEAYSKDTPPLVGANPEEAVVRNSIRPGKVLYDTEGKRIQAHGGAMLFDDGAYYLYGENKDRTDGKSPVWTWGIRCYRSTDLYNWEDLGLIIEPDYINPKSGLYPERHLDRPHIIKIADTGKYVMWIKQSGDEACFMILQADALTGPYTIIREGYRPFDYKVGDFDLITTKDGSSYLFMEGNHVGVFTFRLAADGLSAKELITSSYNNMTPPFCREGIAVLEDGEKKYMISSGMTGYLPNKSDAAVALNWTDEFTTIGNPHVEDPSNASFNSQISKIIPVEGKKNLWLTIADRWVPDFPIDARRADIITRSVAMHYDPEHYQASKEEQAEYLAMPMLENVNTSVADYVWLPLVIEDGKPVIRWYDEWKISDFE